MIETKLMVRCLKVAALLVFASCPGGSGGETGGEATTADSTADATAGTTGGATGNTPTTSGDEPTTADIPEGCGDGVVGAGETCDDGNDVDLDGCNVDCEITAATRWEQSFGGPPTGRHGVNGVAVDDAGAVYVVGWVDSGQALNDEDIWVRKYDAGGVEQWTRSFDGTKVSFSEQAYAVAVMPGGGVVVVASDFDMAKLGATDVRLLRLDGEGTTVWDTVYVGALGLRDYASSVAVAADGTIYLAGVTATGPELADAWIGVFDANGKLTKEATFDSGVFEDEVFSDVALMPDGGLVAVGHGLIEAGGDRDAWIVRLDPQLARVWERFVDGPGGEQDSARNVAVAPDGQVVVVGSLSGNFGDAWIARFDDTGAQVWSQIRDGAAMKIDGTRDVAVDGAGNIVVAGVRRDDAEPIEWLQKLDPTGKEIWQIAGDPELPAALTISALAVGKDHSIAVVGTREVVVEDQYEVWTRVLAP